MTARSVACELRVLLVAGPVEDPTTLAWMRELRRVGVPFDQVSPTQDDPLTAGQLRSASDPAVGRYNGVILATDSSVFWGGLAELEAYRARYGVRQVRGFEYPREPVGLSIAERGHNPAGTTARLTPAGERVFGYLAGPIPVDAGAFGYAATPLPAADFDVLVATAHGHALVGIVRADGGEDLVLTVNYADMMLHWRLLAKGILDWVTRHVYFGHSRHYLSCHIDDVFLSNWMRGTGDDARSDDDLTVRMTAADVDAVLEWQDRSGFTLDLAYNGVGADPTGADGLTAALLASHHRFRWINHTWDHTDLGRSAPVPGRGGGDAQSTGGVPDDTATEPDWLDVDAIGAQIVRNVQWAAAADVALNADELVTGAHSGLDNPHLPAALERTGVAVIATDASVEPEQRPLGPALTVPRHPTNVSTWASSWQEQLAEYGSRYGEGSAGALSPEGFLAAETEVMLRHVLGNDPRPTFAHQSNLTRDRLLLALLSQVLELYRSYLGADSPLCSPTFGASAVLLARQARWCEAVEKGEVSAQIDGRDLVVSVAAALHVPLTVPTGTVAEGGRWRRRQPFGEPYAGTTSGWQLLQAGEQLRLRTRTV